MKGHGDSHLTASASGRGGGVAAFSEAELVDLEIIRFASFAVDRLEGKPAKIKRDRSAEKWRALIHHGILIAVTGGFCSTCLRWRKRGCSSSASFAGLVNFTLVAD